MISYSLQVRKRLHESLRLFKVIVISDLRSEFITTNVTSRYRENGKQGN